MSEPFWLGGAEGRAGSRSGTADCNFALRWCQGDSSLVLDSDWDPDSDSERDGGSGIWIWIWIAATLVLVSSLVLDPDTDTDTELEPSWPISNQQSKPSSRPPGA